jgi:hypothetical protein
VYGASLHYICWWGGIGYGLLYCGIFLATSRSVSLRAARLAWIGFALILLRLGLVALGFRLLPGIDLIMLGAAVSGAVILRLAARCWLVRATSEEVQENIITACRGLLLGCEELPGYFIFTVRGMERKLRVIRMASRIQLLILPQHGGQSKTALLIEWLSKQYPGPIPRLKIVFKRREP